MLNSATALQSDRESPSADVARPAGPAKANTVTILLSDIRGFTSLSEQWSPPHVVAILNEYFEVMVPIIAEHDGIIDKYMGDAIMAIFRSSHELPDTAERAVACAARMQIAMNEVNASLAERDYPRLYMGIGLNTGEVVEGEVGAALHREYTVIGDHVNLTSRIERQSLRGQILLSDNTYERVKDFVNVSQPRLVSVKGKREPIRIYQLLDTERPEALSVPRREPRKSPRVQTSLVCTCRNLAKDQDLPATVIDLGYHGACLEIAGTVGAGNLLGLPVALGLFEAQQGQITARVLRSQRNGQVSTCSVQFIDIEPSAERAIRAHVDARLA